MSAEDRARRVAGLFSRIAATAEIYKDDIKKRDEIIKRMADELWAITKIQEANGELNHFLTPDV
jgi:hypothetical protein